MAKVIGIDLGTTNSVVAVMEGGQPAVIVNQEALRHTRCREDRQSSGHRNTTAFALVAVPLVGLLTFDDCAPHRANVQASSGVMSLVEFFWMSVNLLLISVIYEHTSSIAGWNKYEMMLLVGTSMLIQRFLMGFFWSSIFEMGRNVRTGNFDFFLAQYQRQLVAGHSETLGDYGLRVVMQDYWRLVRPRAAPRNRPAQR